MKELFAKFLEWMRTRPAWARALLSCLLALSAAVALFSVTSCAQLARFRAGYEMKRTTVKTDTTYIQYEPVAMSNDVCARVPTRVRARTKTEVYGYP